MEPENISFGSGVENRVSDEISGKSSSLDEIKNVIAKKLHGVAGELSQKAESPELRPVIGDYGKQAADLLDRSAEYVENFDYHEFNARAREYIREKPGVSLLIAGVAGLILGAIVRRR